MSVVVLINNTPGNSWNIVMYGLDSEQSHFHSRFRKRVSVGIPVDARRLGFYFASSQKKKIHWLRQLKTMTEVCKIILNDSLNLSDYKQRALNIC